MTGAGKGTFCSWFLLPVFDGKQPWKNNFLTPPLAVKGSPCNKRALNGKPGRRCLFGNHCPLLGSLLFFSVPVVSCKLIPTANLYRP